MKWWVSMPSSRNSKTRLPTSKKLPSSKVQSTHACNLMKWIVVNPRLLIRTPGCHRLNHNQSLTCLRVQTLRLASNNQQLLPTCFIGRIQRASRPGCFNCSSKSKQRKVRQNIQTTILKTNWSCSRWWGRSKSPGRTKQKTTPHSSSSGNGPIAYERKKNKTKAVWTKKRHQEAGKRNQSLREEARGRNNLHLRRSKQHPWSLKI